MTRFSRHSASILWCGLVAVALVGCSRSASDAQILAAIDACTKKQEASAKYSTAVSGNATPEQRAQIQAAIAASQQAHANFSKDACTTSVTAICKRDAKACAQLTSGK
jgi:hypothetical protein